MPEKEKFFIVVAGPNGAGKTTFVENNFQDLIAQNLFLNADNFAKELNPDDVSKVAILAGKRFINAVDQHLKGHNTFLIETTLAGLSLQKKIAQAKLNGFTIKLIFLSLSSALLCDFRVKLRVALGGHNIELTEIKRRFQRGLSNLPQYMNMVDSYEIYNVDNEAELIFKKEPAAHENIINSTLYNQFIETQQSISK